jgi:hypothetical protein
MIVDAKDETVQRFYDYHGFALLPGADRCLCLPITAALQRLAGKSKMTDSMNQNSRPGHGLRPLIALMLQMVPWVGRRGIVWAGSEADRSSL